MGRHRLRPALRHVIRQPNRAGVAFIGAYDAIPNLAAVYGMRRLLSTYPADSPLVRLRRSSDNAELDIGALANGDLDTDAAATFIGGSSGFITTLYEQKSGFHATQATAANQPLYVASGQNGHPVARFDGVNDRLQTAAFSSAIAQPNHRLVVAKLDATAVGDAGNYMLTAGLASSPTQMLYKRSSEKWVINAGVLLETIGPNSNWHVFNALYNGASSQLRLDGALAGGGNAGTLSLSGLTIGAQFDGSTPWRGDMAELVSPNAAWSTVDRDAAEAAANSYWSVF